MNGLYIEDMHDLRTEAALGDEIARGASEIMDDGDGWYGPAVLEAGLLPRHLLNIPDDILGLGHYA